MLVPLPSPLVAMKSFMETIYSGSSKDSIGTPPPSIRRPEGCMWVGDPWNEENSLHSYRGLHVLSKQLHIHTCTSVQSYPPNYWQLPFLFGTFGIWIEGFYLLCSVFFILSCECLEYSSCMYVCVCVCVCVCVLVEPANNCSGNWMHKVTTLYMYLQLHYRHL